jgi:hypothetical protein
MSSNDLYFSEKSFIVSYIEQNSSGKTAAQLRTERLRNGEQDWFVGALYYPDFSPDMTFCNAPARSGTPLTQLIFPSVPPYPPGCVEKL